MNSYVFCKYIIFSGVIMFIDLKLDDKLMKDDEVMRKMKESSSQIISIVIEGIRFEAQIIGPITSCKEASGFSIMKCNLIG